jgi:regulator of CtrA degradation
MTETSLNTVNLADRMANSAQFKTLYAEGMALVEETANYLDGPGRTASKALPRLAAVLYAAESMRLTTRSDADGVMAVVAACRQQWRDEPRPGYCGKEQGPPRQLQLRPQRRRAGPICPKPSVIWSSDSLRVQNRVALLDREIYRPE